MQFRAIMLTIAGAFSGVAVASLLSGANAATESWRPSTLLASKAPKGFDDLLRPQMILVDIYYGGDHVGEAMAIFEPGFFAFSRAWQSGGAYTTASAHCRGYRRSSHASPNTPGTRLRCWSND